MTIDAEKEKAAADKRIADEASASAAATANWPTGGYNMFIPHLLIYMSTVLVYCVDASNACLVRTFLPQIQYVISTVYAMIMIYNWINLIEQLPKYSTIQKPNLCRQFSIQGFAAALKPAPFTGTYFKRWQIGRAHV